MVLHHSISMGYEVSIDLTSVRSHLTILWICPFHFPNLDGTPWELLFLLLPLVLGVMTLAIVLIGKPFALVNNSVVTVMRAKIGNVHILLSGRLYYFTRRRQ